ncbi:hypothetical protein [Nocardia donostiensis]|uniref:hypothetical protein n=1 Tax=Nocardia donostiensis TaxID=1538463 RepID=UPI00158CFCC6|nr:hypothetical protein [Nocardia donostiensis]
MAVIRAEREIAAAGSPPGTTCLLSTRGFPTGVTGDNELGRRISLGELAAPAEGRELPV